MVSQAALRISGISLSCMTPGAVVSILLHSAFSGLAVKTLDTANNRLFRALSSSSEGVDLCSFKTGVSKSIHTHKNTIKLGPGGGIPG